MMGNIDFDRLHIGEKLCHGCGVDICVRRMCECIVYTILIIALSLSVAIHGTECHSYVLYRMILYVLYTDHTLWLCIHFPKAYRTGLYLEHNVL